MLQLPKQKYAIRYTQGVLKERERDFNHLTNEYTPFMIFEVLTAVLLKTSVISCYAEGHIVKQSHNMTLLGQVRSHICSSQTFVTIYQLT